ncbi:hypothetical protein CC86DRAFT_408113 [Ophiobolus disseminans]|uniref:F-box domain-containing protein n=1 Tax=Ophiobolus disseminans TaxID=1469910 RepID=A0A6A6ZWV4_9PLEO|nr:hypothetical protein CC86DRAFT_408113 [Ophiobolus disseminans]
MASPEEIPPWHLLRMPYEILKPILAELNQRNQISASKTCVMVWQLAYPLAFNRIMVTIGPHRKESEWRNLASAVGLRYVRYLKIRSLFRNDDKPKRIEDLVACSLIAAVRQN